MGIFGLGDDAPKKPAAKAEPQKEDNKQAKPAASQSDEALTPSALNLEKYCFDERAYPLPLPSKTICKMFPTTCLIVSFLTRVKDSFPSENCLKLSLQSVKRFERMVSGVTRLRHGRLLG